MYLKSLLRLVFLFCFPKSFSSSFFDGQIYVASNIDVADLSRL